MTRAVPDSVLRSVRSVLPEPRTPAEPCGCAACAEQRDREKATADWRALNDAIRAVEAGGR